jgi:acetylornithine deacetylase/succinyl-diaminopimelate desuccinylase-like protein
MSTQVWSDVLPLWLTMLTQFLALRPFSRSNAAGVRESLVLLSALLDERGFTIEDHPNPSPDGAGVIVARRSPRGSCMRTIGMFAHVDVEDVTSGEPWQTPDALVPTLLHGRYFCRGVADNLGPLLARVVAFHATDKECAGVVWVIQGEEEIGSPFAHALLPALKADGKFDGIDLYVEETGYWTLDGMQRVLAMHAHRSDPAKGDELLLPVVDSALSALDAKAGGRTKEVFRRFLNKSFGTHRCPCITHLIDGSVPYISFGINDVASCIHDIDESVPAETLHIVFEQFKAVFSLA